ncbi:hypothetical protein [Streptomyces olivaceoviridis]|uniref:hypothetical protein n=1 Tax=Streptomyces olivaceoviridis TaxID=1921 RepID=UPI0036FC9DAE
MTTHTDIPTYFWVMTVQIAQRIPGAVAMATFNGTVGAAPGETRQDLFTKVRDYVTQQLERDGHPSGHNVLFYSLDTNKL